MENHVFIKAMENSILIQYILNNISLQHWIQHIYQAIQTLLSFYLFSC